MNERIKELVEQANLSADKTYQFDPKDGFQIQEWDKIRLEKFAELIVEQCTDIVMRSDPSPKMILHEPYRTICNNIWEHFGVE